MGRKRSRMPSAATRPDAPTPVNRPFGALAGLRDQLPPGPGAPQAEPAAPQRIGAAVPARAVVRFERKGRRGKAVTVIEKLDLSEATLAAWARELKASLGVGGGVEGEAIVLQGDCRDRVVAQLRERGVAKISTG